MRNTTTVGSVPASQAAGRTTVTTFAGVNNLLSPVEEGFVAEPGRKTTQTESDG